MSLLGIISDTHGLLRPEALDALRGADSVFAVRGNTDSQPWAMQLPLRETIEVDGTLLYLLHDLHDLDLDPKFAEISVVITGHTHRPTHYSKEDVLYLNPGSAGPKRFDLPITLARLNLSRRPLQPEFLHLLPFADQR
jgi:putative phosphoesterase